MSKIYISEKRKAHKVSKYIYGHFAEHLGRCIYEGIWVGEDSEIPNHKGIRKDTIAALKELHIPVLRWPGGCFADEYHWQDGVGEKTERKTIVNTNWGGVVENNHFGTHEFFELCEQLGCEAYVNGNVGSGTVREMQEWVEYMTFEGISPMAGQRKANGREKPWQLKFFGVGNESWACGGNMRPEYYADEYRRYQTFVRNYTERPIYKIACGPNIDDYNWMEVLMKNAAAFMDGISLHHYALASYWEDKRPALKFPEKEWFSLIDSAKKMDELITRHSTIMDQYDPQKRIGLIVDEWGSWLDVEPGTNPGFLYQQNTIRDAMVAAVTLHIFHRHGDRVQMANIAQLVNVLQAMVLTEGEQLIKTPTYHVFEMMKYHQDSEWIDVAEEGIPETVSSSVTARENEIMISICNYGLTKTEQVTYQFDFTITGRSITGEGLVGEKMDDHNSFSKPNKVKKEVFADYTAAADKIAVRIPPMSLATIRIGEQ